MKLYSIIEGKCIGDVETIFPGMPLEQVLKQIHLGFVVVH